MSDRSAIRTAGCSIASASSRTSTSANASPRRCRTASAGCAQLNEQLEQQAEERARQLASSRAQLQAFFDNSADWLTLVHALPDGRFVFADLNPTSEAAYGLPRDQVVGRTVEEILGAEQAGVPLHYFRECLRTGEPQRYVARRTMAGRTTRHRRDVRAGAAAGAGWRSLHHHHRPRHHRARAIGSAVAPGAEDGGDRPAYRRRRARLQQSACRDIGAMRSWRSAGRARTWRS